MARALGFLLVVLAALWIRVAAHAQDAQPPVPPVVPELPPGYQDPVPPPPASDIPEPPADATAALPSAAPPVSAQARVLEEPDDVGFRIPARILTRIHALDRDLTALSLRGDSRVVDGILSLVTGGASIAFGVLYADASTGNNAMATYLYIYGSGSIARGLLQLTLTPSVGDAAIEYGHMPMTSVAETRDRLRFGEEELESLATRSRIARILDASISMAQGLAFIPFYLGPRNFKLVDFLDYFILIGAGVSIASGIVTLFTRSDAERRWAAYVDLREGLRQQRDQQRQHLQVTAAAVPLPGGAAFSLSAVF